MARSQEGGARRRGMPVAPIGATRCRSAHTTARSAPRWLGRAKWVLSQIGCWGSEVEHEERAEGMVLRDAFSSREVAPLCAPARSSGEATHRGRGGDATRISDQPRQGT
jgi:hypothetical protein